MTKGKWVVALGAIMMVVSQMAIGGIIIQDTDGTAGWAADDWPSRLGSPYGTLTPNDPVGNPANALGIDGGAATLGIRQDVIFLDTGDNALWTGDWTATGSDVQLISFDFYSATSVPDGVSLYFSDGVNQWFNDITVSSGWGSYSRNVAFGGGWYNYSGLNNQATWDSSIASVDEVGILLQYRNNVAGQVYGLDNFTLDDEPLLSTLVPEPETYAMLGFAILSLGVTFRKKLDESLALALQQLRS